MGHGAPVAIAGNTEPAWRRQPAFLSILHALAPLALGLEPILKEWVLAVGS